MSDTKTSVEQYYRPPLGANWMQVHAEYLGPLRLNQACILGSHDSATAGISRHSHFGLDVESKVGRWRYLPFAHSIAAEWARTQQLFIFDQLTAGVRYFDFRICQTKQQELYTSHALLGRPIRYVIEALRSFNLSYPDEILFLDFNHFYGLSNADHQKLIGLLQQAFKGKLLPRSAGLEVTYADLWQTDYRIIVFYHHPPCLQQHANLWGSQHIYSLWPDVLRFRSLKSFLEYTIEDTHSQRLMVRQCILSPSFWQVFRSLLTFTMLPASLSLLAYRVNRKVLKWLRQLPIARRKSLGVVMIDWCTESIAREFLEFTINTNKQLSAHNDKQIESETNKDA